jgi:hypothetical protein
MDFLPPSLALFLRSRVNSNPSLWCEPGEHLGSGIAGTHISGLTVDLFQSSLILNIIHSELWVFHSRNSPFSSFSHLVAHSFSFPYWFMNFLPPKDHIFFFSLRYNYKYFLVVTPLLNTD